MDWKNLSKLLRVSAVALLVAFASKGMANEKVQPTGLIPPTKEELENIHKHGPKIHHVRPNKIGAARIHAHMKKKGMATANIPVAKFLTEEFVTTTGDEKGTEFATMIPILPSSVDNSKLMSFPPIGNQMQLGSCVAWATTYYQATHETGLVNGSVNKSTYSRGVLSPKWTYNMINGGYDNGSSFTDAYRLLSQNGAASLLTFPYNTDYLSWDMYLSDWISALSYRLTPVKYITGVNTNLQDLTAIKSALNNGHVLTFGTYFNGWQTTTIQSNPNTLNKYVGEQAITYTQGMDGGHLITVVGYDDDVWIDVNGNNKVDAGEKGAFLVANSFGQYYGNAGYMWISYDAFRAVSAVPPYWPETSRTPAALAGGNYFFLATAKDPYYTPKLIAQFSLNQQRRYQVKVGAGASPFTQMTPTSTFVSGALSYQGGAYPFRGNNTQFPLTASFALDLTDLIGTSALQRYYLSVSDDLAGYPTAVSNFSLLDPATGNTFPCTTSSVSLDNTTKTLYVDYNPPVTNTLAIHPQPSIHISSPQSEEQVSGEFLVSALVENTTAVDFYVDSALISTDDHAPYLVLIDSSEFPNGRHEITAVAKNKSGQSSTTSVAIYIQN
ncbi:MAG: hypothetical protein KGJ02_06310 [Verrucomicrobiota bacterium]|nr:hypothetical protein [Verrucomicrobiota bacterium]